MCEPSHTSEPSHKLHSTNPNAVLISTCPDPDSYLFWDGTHPTSKVSEGRDLIWACHSV